MEKELREKRKAPLKEYEQTVIKAADIRKAKFKQAQDEFDATKKDAHQKYQEALGKL